MDAGGVLIRDECVVVISSVGVYIIVEYSELD